MVGEMVYPLGLARMDVSTANSGGRLKLVLLAVVITVMANLWCAYYTHANTRKSETTDEEIAATDEMARWAGLHPEVAYYESRRVPPKDDAPWTVEVYVEVGPKVTLKWSEAGWSHLLDAVHEIEKDYDAYPRGHEGHSNE